MYNKIKIVILFIALITISKSITAQRNVFWVHGNGSNGLAWNYLEDNLEGNNYGVTGLYRLTTKSKLPYNTASGVSSFVSDFISQNPDNFFAVPSGNQPSIAICHSMGGLMFRHFDLVNPNKIGGIITVGTPLRGAKVANSFIDGSVKNYVDNASYQLNKAINDDYNVNQLPYVITALGNLKSKLSAFSYGNFKDQISGFASPPTVVDLAENSTINNVDGGHSASTTPKISIYGNEASPVFWRLVGSAKSKVHPIDEQDGPNSGEADRNKLANYFAYERDSYYSLVVSSPLNLFGWNLSFYYSYLASEYNDGLTWIQSDSENGW